jgi:hypothetical protein
VQRESSREILSKKKWRAITYNWDILSQMSDTTRLYCLSDFQVAWLLSNCSYFGWETRWENLSIGTEELNEKKASLEYALMDCIDIQPYQMDYLYQQAIADDVAGLQSDYDAGGIAGVNTNTPTDFYDGDGSSERIDALCTACYLYCYSYSTEWVSRAQTALGIAVVVGLASSVSIVGGVIASVLVGGLAYITSIALNAFNDTDAIDKVVCCMYDGLVSLSMTQGNFEDSLNSCSFTAGSNESIIRDIIASDLGQLGNWLSFINALGDAFVYAENGVVLCASCTGEWSSTLNLKIDDYGFIFTDGEWQSGVGFVPTAATGSDNRLLADLSLDTCTVIEIGWVASITIAVNPEGNATAQYLIRNGTSFQSGSMLYEYPTDTPIGTTDLTSENDGFTSTIDNIRLFLRPDNDGFTGSGAISEITIRGTGVKPSQLP